MVSATFCLMLYSKGQSFGSARWNSQTKERFGRMPKLKKNQQNITIKKLHEITADKVEMHENKQRKNYFKGL